MPNIHIGKIYKSEPYQMADGYTEVTQIDYMVVTGLKVFKDSAYIEYEYVDGFMPGIFFERMIVAEQSWIEANPND